MSMKRLFFALDISPRDKNILIHWREQHQFLAVKPVSKDNLHITLAFLGQIKKSAETKLINQANEYVLNTPTLSQHYHLVANELGLFRKPQVLYLAFPQFPSELTKLANYLSAQASKLGIFQEKRDFLPHLSIARKAKLLPEVPSLALPINISSFSLYASQSTERGVMYTPIKSWFFCTKISDCFY
ncbi:RNA 2',3'-cyclic phosphodiesterase [Thalassotalea sp. G2M2-11]|uniref:RNA 2',3'-cyclic phosphodiesterase n=1 Tax=Thalassotalea sp. G2M2-11 TaxID=2787627 RepID=UPI0019D16D85|nr:RNA 2',3'-cyclic phosphodiesterase [Thalassotalea sp. G2M2-11]